MELLAPDGNGSAATACMLHAPCTTSISRQMHVQLWLGKARLHVLSFTSCMLSMQV